MMGVAENPQIPAELRREIEDPYKTGFRFAEIARQACQADILAYRRQEQLHAARPVHRIYPRGIGGESFHRRHMCEVIAACHEPVVFQIGKFCRGRVFLKVRFRSVDSDRQVPEPSSDHLVMAFRAGLQRGECDVDIVGMNRAVAIRCRDQVDGNFGKCVAETTDSSGQKAEGEIERGAHPDEAGRTPVIDIGFAQQVHGRIGHILGCGQRHAVGPTVEEPLTQLGLQAVDPAQYRRAMNAERVGRSIQRAEMACRAKNSEVVPIQHVLHYCTCVCD